jgi:outer membrane protein OmpA-like peptidoglycan-associated protein
MSIPSHRLVRVAAGVLACCVSVPLLAQSAGSQSQSSNQQIHNAQIHTGATAEPSSAQTNSSEVNSTLENESTTPPPPLTVESHEGFWGHLNPFARKSWVQRDLAPVKGRLNELDQVTARDRQNISDVDARAQAGIAKARNTAEQADQAATTAGNTANQAQQLAQQASARTNAIGTAVKNLDQYQTVSRVVIRFHGSTAALGENSRQALDQLANNIQNQPGYLIDVRGYTRRRGTAGVSESHRMALAVTRYLVTERKIPLYRIHEIGLGNTPATGSDWSIPRSGGVVEVTLMNNGLSNLRASNAEASASKPGTGMSR